MTRPRLVIADDREDVLREVSALLKEQYEVVGVARDGATLIEIAADLNPDVVITDFKMPGLSGIKVGSMLLERGLCRAVVLLTMYADQQLVAGAMQAGILGFVLKVKAGEDLIPAINTALGGRPYVSTF